MRKYHPENERIKRKYFDWQHGANGRNQVTVDNYRKALDRFEAYTRYKDFKTFNLHQAKGFKNHIRKSTALRTGDPLSRATMLSTLRILQNFFKWLAYESGYKRKIDISHIEYLNLSEKEVRIAQAPQRKRCPTIEQINHVIHQMPTATEINLRDRTLIAFAILTGARDGALASLRLKHVQLEKELLEQPGREVKTKFSKTIYTYFFPVGDDIKQIVVDWVNYLLKEKLYDKEAPIFPRTRLAHDENRQFTPVGLEPIGWQNAGPIPKGL